MNVSKFENALEVISGIKSKDDFEGSLGILRKIYGLSHLGYCGFGLPKLDDKNPLIVVTYPHEWMERYRRENFFEIDPVFAAGRKAFLPIDWSTLDHESAEARHVFAEAEQYEIGGVGMLLPINGPVGDSAGFTFTANMLFDDWTIFHRRYLGEIAMVGQYFHSRVIDTLGYLPTGKTSLSLSPRERECLQLLSDGKVPKQIAVTLNLSEAAVRLYMKRARARLGTSTLLQTVIKAIRANLIDAR